MEKTEIIKNDSESQSDQKSEVSDQKSDPLRIRNIAFSGGGASGFALAGVLKAFEEHKILQNVKSMSGSSAGAIFATLITIGYTYAELYQFVRDFEYKFVSDIQILGILDNFGAETE